MSLKEDDIFPGHVMLDCYDVCINVKSDAGNLSLSSNMLDFTFHEGIIPTPTGVFRTPFHRLAAMGYKAFSIDSHKDLSYESVFTFQEEMRPESAKVYQVSTDDSSRVLLVLDGSYAWLLELPFEERNLDNYSVCITAYCKYFKALCGVKTHADLAMAILDEFDRADAIDTFLKKIKGRKAFNVNDYRLTSTASELGKYIHDCAIKRGNVSLEFFMYWYHGVSRHLLAAGLPEANVIDFFKKHKIQLGYIKAHGNGLTPETYVKRCLEKPKKQEEYNEYAKPKVRVTKRMIAAFRKELEQEYRKIQENSYGIITEEYIQEQCYGVCDDYIIMALKRHESAADVVYWDML